MTIDFSGAQGGDPHGTAGSVSHRTLGKAPQRIVQAFALRLRIDQTFQQEIPRTQYITVIFSNIIPYPEYPLVIYNRLRTGRYHQFSFFLGEITDKWVIFIHMLHYQMVNSCQQPVKQWNFHQNFDMEPAGASPNSWPIARNHDKFHELFWWYQTFQAIIFVTNNSTINNILR